MALYGDPNDRNPCSILYKPRTREQLSTVKGIDKANTFSTVDDCPQDELEFENETMGDDEEISEYEDSSEEEEEDDMHTSEKY